MLASNTLNFSYSCKSLGLVLLGLGLSLDTNALDFTVDPGSLGLSGDSFTADTLIASDASNIAFTDASGSFYEQGYGFITGALLNDSTVATNGLGNNYSLYFSFTDTGNAITDAWNSGTFTLYAVSGKSTFGIDPYTNVVQVNNTGTPILLGALNFNSGYIGGDAITILTASLNSAFVPCVF